MAMLVWFLGASALPFCDFFFLVFCLGLCTVTHKAKGQRSAAISHEQLYGYPCMLNMCHGAHVVLAQRNKMAAHPFLGVGWLRNKLECVKFIRYFMEIISIYIHFQYRQKVYIIGKSRYGDIFSMTMPITWVNASNISARPQQAQYGSSFHIPYAWIFSPCKNIMSFYSVMFF